jgi:hypothetical protein
MPRNQHKKSAKAELTAVLLRHDSEITVPKAMRRCGFTKEESENTSNNKQRCVRKHRQRLREKAQENQALTGATVIVNNRPFMTKTRDTDVSRLSPLVYLLDA